MVSLLHVAPSLDAGAPRALILEHEVALQSWVRAQAQVSADVSVTVRLVRAVEWPDRSSGAIEDWISPTLSFRKNWKMDRFPPVLDHLAGHEFRNFDYVMLTNSDICIVEEGYGLVLGLVGPKIDAISVHRRTLDSLENPGALSSPELRAMSRSHPGSDCFVARPQVFDQLVRILHPKLVFGIPPVGGTICSLLDASAANFTVFKDSCATYHIGNERRWRTGSENQKARKSNFWAAACVLTKIRQTLGWRAGLKGLRRFGHGSAKAGFLRLLLGIGVTIKQESQIRTLVNTIMLPSRIQGRRIISSLRFRLRSGPEVMVVSGGGVSTTTLMNHLSGYVRVNSPDDRDGVKHSRKFPKWAAKSRTRVIFVRGARGPQVSSLLRRGVGRRQLFKLRGFAALFTLPRNVPAALARAMARQAKEFSRHEGDSLLIIDYPDYFSNISVLADYLGLGDTDFEESFPEFIKKTTKDLRGR